MKWYGATDIGLKRKVNQDSYVIASNDHGDVLALICDGIGGGKSGDVASGQAIQYFSEVFSQSDSFKDEQEVKNWITFHVQKANDAVFTLSTTDIAYQGMGTTLVGTLISHVGTFILNVGDSRAYGSFVNREFSLLTEDHTLLQDLINKGEVSLEEAKAHPKRHLLTNALGIWDKTKVDIKKIDKPVDSLLICSDGLHGYVDHETMKTIILDPFLPIQQKSKKLMSCALEAGGFDNITIIIIEMEGDEYI